MENSLVRTERELLEFLEVAQEPNANNIELLAYLRLILYLGEIAQGIGILSGMSSKTHVRYTSNKRSLSHFLASSTPVKLRGVEYWVLSDEITSNDYFIAAWNQREREPQGEPFLLVGEMEKGATRTSGRETLFYDGAWFDKGLTIGLSTDSLKFVPPTKVQLFVQVSTYESNK